MSGKGIASGVLKIGGTGQRAKSGKNDAISITIWVKDTLKKKGV
jgi:hypothetical protein